MIGYVEAPRAWWVTHGMARVIGVSLPRAVTEGWLKRSELARLVERCQDCGTNGQCASWLALHQSAETVPDFCPNKAEIESLAP